MQKNRLHAQLNTDLTSLPSRLMFQNNVNQVFMDTVTVSPFQLVDEVYNTRAHSFITIYFGHTRKTAD